jgi:hypothetical protein
MAGEVCNWGPVSEDMAFELNDVESSKVSVPDLAWT